MIISRRLTFTSLLLAATMLASPLIIATPTAAQVGISVQVAPPALPIYAQPPIPAPGYMWTPGYWQWSPPLGYSWVPGTWVMPPMAGVLWTPPYWGWVNGLYVFHAGYWGPHVGYYGGVNYGFGYGGRGYQGGRWEGGNFVYNRAVNNFGSAHIDHVYDQRVTAANNNRVSYAGGAGGLRTAPSAAEGAAEREQHAPATAEQTQHFAAAARMPALAASRNHGRPAIAATSHAAQFAGPGVVRAGAVAHPAGARPATAQRPAAGHPGAEQGREERPER